MKLTGCLLMGTFMAMTAMGQYVIDVKAGAKGMITGSIGDLKKKDGKVVDIPAVPGLSGVNFVAEVTNTMLLPHRAPIERLESLTFGVNMASDSNDTEVHLELLDAKRKRWEKCQHVLAGLDFEDHLFTMTDVARFVNPENRQIQLRIRSEAARNKFSLSVDRVVFKGKLKRAKSAHEEALASAAVQDQVKVNVYESSASGTLASKVDEIRGDWKDSAALGQARPPSNKGALKKSMESLKNKNNRGGKKRRR